MADLTIIIKAVDEASRVLTGVGGQLNSMRVPLTAAGAAMAGVGAAALKMGGDWNDANKTIAAGTGATGKALEALQADFRAVARTGPDSIKNVATAIADLNTRLGLTGKPLQDVSRQFLDFSRVANTEVGGAVRDITRIMGDWDIATADVGVTLDKVLVASQSTGISVERLSQTIVQYGAPLRAMNFTFEESAALLGKWEKEGVNTELVLGSLRIAMGNFAREGIPMRQGLEDVIAQIQLLGPGAEATALAMETFGARAGPDMAAAILEGRFAIDELVGVISDAEGAVADTREEMEGWRETLATLKNNVLGAIGPHLDLAGGILTVAGTVTIMAANIGPAIMAVRGLGAALLFASANPIVLIIAGLVAVGVAVVLLIKHWDEVKAATIEVWDSIKNFLTENWREILAVASLFLLGPAGLVVLFTSNAFGIRDKVVEAFTDLWNKLKEVVGEMVADVIAMFSQLPGELYNIGKKAAQGLLDGLKSIPGALFGGFGRSLPSEAELEEMRRAAMEGRQHGGPVVAGRPYMVGERGPELFVPGQNGAIVPNTPGLGGVHFHGPVTIAASSRMEAEESAQVFGWGIMAAARARGYN
jgi:hypothetical protein